MDASCSKEQLRRIHWKRACHIRSHEEQKTSQEKTLMTHYEQNFKELKTMLSNYSNINLYRVTKFYKQRLTDAIYPFCDCIAFAVDSKHLPDENYKDVISLYDKNQKREAAHYLMDTVIAKKNCDTIMEMWEYILLASTKSIKLKNLLTEMQMKGNNVLSDAQLKEFGVKDIPDTLRDCVKEHKNVLAEKNKEIQVNTILGKETINIFPLEDNFIELIVVSASEERRLKEDELLSRGKEHEKLCQQVVQNERETVRYDEIFGSSFGNKCNARLAVISGVAGIGKSTLVQKIVFEWAIDRIYEQFHFVFPFKFRDLNRLTNISIHDMILHFYPYLKLHLSTILMKPEQVLFIFDGYDEFNSPIHARSELDIQFDKAACQSAAWSCSTTDIVSSLLQEKLLKDCSVLITTRPTALQFLHKVNIHLHLEVMGFSEEQRKEYFHKFTGDTKTSEKMFKYVEENDILYTMCYNPAYCAIICSSLEPAFKSERELQTPVLKTVTQLYSNFIYNILKHHNREHGESQKVLENLGDMAFMGVQDKVIVFDENHLSRFSLEPSQFLSGFLMEIFSRDESCQNIIYTFYHLTIQEFIAALVKSTPNPLEDITSLLDKAAEYKDGRCEVFLRFIVGLSTTEHKLEEFIREKTQTTVNKVIDWVKSKLHANSTGRQLLNAFHYLFETQNKELTESIMKDIKSIELQNITLSPVDCYLMFSLLSHCDEIAVLNIKDCNIQPESLKKLQPVLRNCGLLRLQGNNIGDESVKWLSEDLQKTGCKIHSLELENNKIGHLGLKYLSENLKSCTLKELRLCSNNIGDQGICCLSDALQSHYCNITRLGLSLSGITSSGMKQLSEALKHPNCKIKKLWLNGNNIENSGVKYLSDALLTSQYKLEFLSMCNVGMGEPGIRDLSDTLQRPFCDLSELYINGNYITASGVKYLAEALQSPCCKLQTLTLCESKVDDPGMKCLSAAITDLNCRLKQLDLRVNQIGSLGMEHLWKAMKSHPCKIEDLKLCYNNIGDAGVKCLSKALRNKHCNISELGLTAVGMGPSGMKSLSKALQNTHCKMKTLWLGGNTIEDSGIKSLSKALKSSYCKLEITDLCAVEMRDDGIKVLSEALMNPKNNLHDLYLSDNKFQASGAQCLAKALQSQFCKLSYLRLRNNRLGNAGVKVLVDAQQHPNCKLKQLELDNSEVIEARIQWWPEALKSPCGKLDILECNEEGDSGLKAMLEALENLDNPKYLGLHSSEVGDSGIELLCKFLKRTSYKLENLKSNICEMSDFMTERLHKLLKTTESDLEYLELHHNKIGDTGAKMLAEVLKTPYCTVQQLDIWQNSLSEAMERELKLLEQELRLSRPGIIINV